MKASEPASSTPKAGRNCPSPNESASASRSSGAAPRKATAGNPASRTSRLHLRDKAAGAGRRLVAPLGLGRRAPGTRTAAREMIVLEVLASLAVADASSIL